jgi:hypothetical protein
VDVAVDGGELVELGGQLLDVGDEEAGGVDELGLADRSWRVDVGCPGLADAIGTGGGRDCEEFGKIKQNGG